MDTSLLKILAAKRRKTRLSLWCKPGNDVFGYSTRNERMVNSVAQMLDIDAPGSHFHSQLMQMNLKLGVHRYNHRHGYSIC